MSTVGLLLRCHLCSFLKQDLLLTWDSHKQSGLAGQQSSGAGPVSTTPALGLHMLPWLAFYLVSGNQN